MKKQFAILTTLLISGSFASAQTAAEIDTLITQKSFFKASELFQLKKNSFTVTEQLFLGAELDNAFNRLQASNEKIDILQKEYKKVLTPEQHFALLELQQGNYAKLYNYRKASESINTLLKRYSKLITKEQRKDFENTNLIWKSLADAPAQTIEIAERSIIPLKKDKVGLSNMDVYNGDTHIDFIFDTGANISTITETTAKQLNMRLIDVKIEVNSITGIKVNSKLAVCPEFHIGHITVRNAVFLVFPDSALAVPQIAYQINGIIGFPIIEAMKEVQITQSGEFIVPKERSTTTSPNMALDFLTPVLLLEGDIYTFDSGANSTMLYKPYFDKHQQEIESGYTESDLQYGGAGGNITRKGYTVTWKPILDGKELEIPGVMVFKDKQPDKKDYIYGNIGQDVIKQFDKMTLNFEGMFIRFE